MGRSSPLFSDGNGVFSMGLFLYFRQSMRGRVTSEIKAQEKIAAEPIKLSSYGAGCARPLSPAPHSALAASLGSRCTITFAPDAAPGPAPRLTGNLMSLGYRHLSRHLEMDIHQHQIPALRVFKSCRPATPGVACSGAGDRPLRLSSSTARSIKSCSAVAAKR